MWRLEVGEWVGPARWRWRLSDSADSVGVVEHEVMLDPTVWQFEAFADLYRFLQWNVSPDRRREHEAELLAEVGDWIGQHVLGPVADAIGTRRGTVRMELPAQAAVLGYRSWELARVGGRSWAASRVRVVVVPQPYRPLTKNAVGGRLRMLAVFSLPDGGGALNLRRERFELARLVREIAQVHGCSTGSTRPTPRSPAAPWTSSPAPPPSTLMRGAPLTDDTDDDPPGVSGVLSD